MRLQRVVIEPPERLVSTVACNHCSIRKAAKQSIAWLQSYPVGSLTHAESHSATTAGLRMNNAELNTTFALEIIAVQPAGTVSDNCNVLLCVDASVGPVQSVVCERNTPVLCHL